MSSSDKMLMPGGLTADGIPTKSRYELDDGHPVWCAPTGGRGGRAQLGGSMVIGSDPAVKAAGTDVGYSPRPSSLRAPDISVLPDGDPAAPGWSKGVPPLAIEYADVGQDEDALQRKINDLLASGTQYIWVVRLEGIRRVEVHTPGHHPYLRTPGQDLEAPGVLAQPVPVEALYDEDEARRVTLRNLLLREGYESIEAIREEGHKEGGVEALRSALLAVLSARGIEVDKASRDRIEAGEPADLNAWIIRASRANDLAGVFSET